jgi:polyphosphate kinase
MRRNLESRVEVVAPVEDIKLRQELRLILDVQLTSKKHVWEMQSDGTYIERSDPSGTALSSQDTFIALAQKRKKAAATHRQSRLREKLLTYFRKRVIDEQ